KVLGPAAPLTVTINEGIADFTGGANITTTSLTLNHANAQLRLTGARTITGSIKAETENEGIITITDASAQTLGAATDIGTAAKPIGSIVFGVQDSEIIVPNSGKIFVNKLKNNKGTAAGHGKITINAIRDVPAHLAPNAATISMGSGVTVTDNNTINITLPAGAARGLNVGDLYINKLELAHPADGDNTSELKLGTVDGVLNADGTITNGQKLTAIAGIVFGANANNASKLIAGAENYIVDAAIIPNSKAANAKTIIEANGGKSLIFTKDIGTTGAAAIKDITIGNNSSEVTIRGEKLFFGLPDEGVNLTDASAKFTVRGDAKNITITGETGGFASSIRSSGAVGRGTVTFDGGTNGKSITLTNVKIGEAGVGANDVVGKVLVKNAAYTSQNPVVTTFKTDNKIVTNAFELGAGGVLDTSNGAITIAAQTIQNTAGGDSSGAMLLINNNALSLKGFGAAQGGDQNLNIGSTNDKLEQIKFTNVNDQLNIETVDAKDAFLHLNKAKVHDTDNTAKGKIDIKTKLLNIYGTIGEKTRPLKEVKLNNTAGGNASTVVLNNDAVLYTEQFEIGGNQANKLELMNSTSIFGGILINGNDDSKISFKGKGAQLIGNDLADDGRGRNITNKGIIEVDGGIDGKIEGHNIEVTKIDLKDEAKLEVVITDETQQINATDATGITIGNGAEFTITHNATNATTDVDYVLPSNITAKNTLVNGNGSKLIYKSTQNSVPLRIEGNIGATGAGNSLFGISVEGNKSLKLGKAGAKTYINNIHFANPDQSTFLEFLAGTHNINTITAGSEGASSSVELRVNNGVTIEALEDTTSLGQAETPLRKLEINNNAGAATVTFGDKINVYAQEVTVKDGDNSTNANLSFKGAVTFSGKMSNQLGKITHETLVDNGNVISAELAFLQDININGDINIPKNGTFSFAGTSLTGNAITGKGGGDVSIFKTTNTAATKIDATIENSVSQLEFAGGDVEFVKNVTTTNILMSSENKVTVTFNGSGTKIGDANIDGSNNGANDKIRHVFELKQSADEFTGEIKMVDFKIGSGTISFKTDKELDLSVNPISNNQGTVNLNVTENTTKEHSLEALGSSDGGSLSKVNVNGRYRVGSIFAGTVNVAEGSQLKSKELTLTGNLNLQKGSILTIENDAILNAKIRNDSGVGGKGAVITEGNVFITQDMFLSGTKGEKIEFNNSGTVDSPSLVTTSGSLYANKVELNGAKFKLAKDITVDSLLIANENSIIDLQTFELKFDSSDSGLTLNKKVQIDVTVTESGHGKITIPQATGSTLNYNDTTLLINLSDTNLSGRDGIVAEGVQVIINNGSLDADDKFDASKITINNPNANVDWEPFVDKKGNIVLKGRSLFVENNLEEVNGSDPATEKNGAIIANLNNEYSDDLERRKGLFGLPGDAGRVNRVKSQQLVAGAGNTAVTGPNVNLAVSSGTGLIQGGINQTLVNRGAQLTAPSGALGLVSADDNDYITGLSAGDEEDNSKYGVWGSPFYNRTVKGESRGTPGYKSDIGGATIGADGKLNDDFTLGTALTLANTSIKLKNLKQGSKVRSDGIFLSMYGMQRLTDNWYGQAIATVGVNDVKNDDIRLGANGTEIAKSSFSSTSLSGDVRFGYNINLVEGFTFTPIIGGNYLRINDYSYTETGAKGQNLNIAAKATNRLDAIVGARVTAKSYNVENFEITPEVHGFLNYAVLDRTPRVQVRFDGSSSLLATNFSKQTKTIVNAGFSVDAKYSNMNYTLGYDFNGATKLKGHQGSLKVRVNF
ncbi:MAG: autotransporter outer membrane beta-barrel domain-containing protein, partial [Rickettsiaceae bacterium]|nr:autotransporter outer membrane beta-barrel domain-containing protein [Rickettsiaceae bacterium]